MSRFLTKIINDPPGKKGERVKKDATHLSAVVATHKIEKVATSDEMVGNLVATTSKEVGNLVATASETDTHQIPLVATHEKGRVAPRKGDRHNPNKTRLVGWIDKEIFKRIKHYCVDRGISIGEFVETVGVHHIDLVGSHQNANMATGNVEVVGTLLPHDDLMRLYKTDEDIIRLYQKYNPGNKWRATDDAVACKYNKVDRRILEYAMVLTKVNARFKKINSFKYYEDEINCCVDKHLSLETMDAMVESARRTWTKAHVEKRGSEP